MNMRFLIEFLLPTIISVAVVLGGVVGLVYWEESVSCNQLQEINPDYNFRFDFPSGCKMQTPDGLYIHLSHIQHIDCELKTPQTNNRLTK